MFIVTVTEVKQALSFICRQANVAILHGCLLRTDTELPVEFSAKYQSVKMSCSVLSITPAM